jgi:glutathione S-transferase
MQAGSAFKRAIAAVSPAARVPVLVDGELVIWDSLAIAEYLAERFPDRQLWPADAAARARARSVCAEMHGGFAALRQHCSMNIEAHLPEVGHIVRRDHPGVQADLDRIAQMWGDLLSEHGGPMLFGHFTVPDAYYAPGVMRIRTYGLPMPPAVTAYCDRVTALPGVSAWIEGGLAEKTFVRIDEPYRVHREDHLGPWAR